MKPITNPSLCFREKSYDSKGFTLIELLVVLVIVGVMVGMATLTPGDRKYEQLEKEVNRFQALMQLALDESVMQSRQLALGFYQNGYGFFEQIQGEDQQLKWVLKSGDEFLRQRLFPEEWKLQLYLEGLDVDLPDEEKLKEQVFILSSGEITPFTIEIDYPFIARVKIEVDAIGQMAIDYKRKTESEP